MNETPHECTPLVRVLADRRSLAQLLAAVAGAGHDLDPTVLNARWLPPEPPTGDADLLGLNIRADVGHVAALRLIAGIGMRPASPEEALRLALQHPEALLPERAYLAAGRMAMAAGSDAPFVLEIFRDAHGVIHFDLATTQGTWTMAGEYLFLVTPHPTKGTADVRA